MLYRPVHHFMEIILAYTQKCEVTGTCNKWAGSSQVVGLAPFQGFSYCVS